MAVIAAMPAPVSVAGRKILQNLCLRPEFRIFMAIIVVLTTTGA
jgi:hypothetical protein